MATALRRLSQLRRPRGGVAASVAGQVGRGRGGFGIIPLVTLALFLAPIGVGLLATLGPAFGYLPALGGHRLTLDPWKALVAEPGLTGAVGLSLFTGFASTVVSVLLALSLCASWHRTAVFRAMHRVLAPLLAMPHAALAIGLAFLMAPSGWVVRLISPWLTGWQVPPDLILVQDPYGIALILGLVAKETPFLLLMALGALNQIDTDRPLAVARTMGYGSVSAWLRVVLPQIYPLLRLPIYAVLAFSLSVVDMAMILGPTTPPPLAPLILRWFNDPDLSRRFLAAAGAVLQLLLVIGGIGAWRAGEWLVALVARPMMSLGARGGRGWVLRAASATAMAAMILGAAASMAGIAVWSMTDQWRYPDPLPAALGLETWRRTLATLAVPAWTTLSVGVVATLVALVLVVGCLEHEKRSGVRPTTRALWLLYTPLLVPQIAFLFGVQVLLVILRLDGHWLALVWCHLLFVLPYAFLALSDPWRALDPRYERTARCLGTPPLKVFLAVTVPMMLRPLAFAAAIGFSVSVALYLPTVFAGAGRLTTLTTEAVGLAAGADRRVVGVYAFAQLALPMVVFAAALALPALRFRRRRGMAA